MKLHTRHRFLTADARSLGEMDDESIDLIVTSPPYPMIAMWDEVFASSDPAVDVALSEGDGSAAFEMMHRQLDAAWDECVRVLRPGRMLCVNVGDAVRTVGGSFRLYPNHARIVESLAARGLTSLPGVIWRKATNSPTKFMGSGMLPGGAYLTLEHEHILVARKGPPRRVANDAERMRRRNSAFFWEERNRWFSDCWELAGSRQKLHDSGVRDRSGAFPLEIPFRLIAMYSWEGDTVFDPFAGTGTTLLAALALGRSSVSVEIDSGLREQALKTTTEPGLIEKLARRSLERLEAHRRLLDQRRAKHFNESLHMPVVTSQERELRLWRPVRVSETAAGVECDHEVVSPRGGTEET